MAKASDNLFPSVLLDEGSAPSNPSAGTQRLFIDSADHQLKRVNSAGTVTTVEGGGGSSLPAPVSFFRASGDLTMPNNNTWDNLASGCGLSATAFDLTIAASAGDVIEFSMSARVIAGADYVFFDFVTVVAGTDTNSFATNGGAHQTGTSGAGLAMVKSSDDLMTQTAWLYTVQAGDVDGGNVTVRPWVRKNGTSAPGTLCASGSSGPMQLNLRRVA